MEMALHCRNHWDVVEGLRQCSRCGQTFCRDCLVGINGRPYCAGCKNEQLLDVRSGVAMAANLDLADPGRRFVALLIDGFITGIPFIVLMTVAMVSIFSANRMTPETILWFQPLMWLLVVGQFVYEGLMLAARGQTVGKIAMKIKVVRPDGSDISTGQAWGRAAMRHILASCLCIINYLPAFFTQEKTTLHDMVASTRVVNWS